MAAGGSVSSGYEKEEEQDECSGGVDRISELPEGILLSILSLLTLKDAVRTSLLSRRWVDLWKSAVRELDFDLPEVSQLLDDRPGLIPARRIKFKNWVTRVVRQLNDASYKQLTKFRVSFTLTNQCNSKGAIDRWMKFAITKRVEFLELSFVNLMQTSNGNNYVFPEDCFNHIRTPAGLSDIRSLRSLRLSCVDVKEEAIEHFISNCPYLEELAVCESELLVKLKITAAGSSSAALMLKRLEVVGCMFVESLEIDNVPCLTHFTYHGPRLVELRLESCVSLVDVTIGFLRCKPNLALDSISCYAGQLAALTVRINSTFIRLLNVAEFARLELLTIEISASYDTSMMDLVRLINACPRLHSLRLEMLTYFTQDSLAGIRGPDVVRVACKSIKTVEIIGFTGYPIDHEFMEYVLKCFVGMERIVLHLNLVEQGEEARKHALEFKSRASPAIDFVVV